MVCWEMLLESYLCGNEEYLLFLYDYQVMISKLRGRRQKFTFIDKSPIKIHNFMTCRKR